MEAAGAAVGIASLGIQVCQGLLDYYNGWKDYQTDIAGAYNSIADLYETLALLKVSLDDKELDHDRAERAKEALESCKDGLTKLSKKLQKLQTHDKPQGSRQRLWAEFQRGSYPFKASTLAKLREIVDDVMERLKLALQVLQLDVSISSQKTLLVVAAETKETAKRTAIIGSTVMDIAAAQQADQFKKIANWLSAPDPWTNHDSAREKHEPHTGAWLLQSDQYLAWKAGFSRHLWAYGKAGCGKTVLSYTAIEDMQIHCKSDPSLGHAAFYFSFSDNDKQTYNSLLRSMAVQLAWQEPALSMLRQSYDRPGGPVPGTEELQKIVLTSIRSYDAVHLQLDALDECPENGGLREAVLGGLERLAQGASNLRIFTTSRELRDVRESMDRLGAAPLLIATDAVNMDIQRYVSLELGRDPKLSRLNLATKSLIEDTIGGKADGMFRWAYCQLQELKKLKSVKPKYVESALYRLPSTLDETYERMLVGIERMYREEALTLLRWLAYARSPPTLGQLAEAAIVDPVEGGSVDFNQRGNLEDTLDILSGLVTKVEKPGQCDCEECRYDPAAVTVRLAHFSVQEYLESGRIKDSEARDFYLEVGMGHEFLAHSCLTYLEHYSASEKKTSTDKDLFEFPLLKYAAEAWYDHSFLRADGEVAREISFLCQEQFKDDWLLVHRPDRHQKPFEENSASDEERRNNGSALYYASFLGLEVVASALIDGGAQVNERGGDLDSALQAASRRGTVAMVQMLLDAGAEVNAQGGFHGNALHAAASEPGRTEVVQILLDAGANVNAQGGEFGNALQAASFEGSQSVVKLLLDAGADVNAQGGEFGNALQAASFEGSQSVVKLLLDAGANVNAGGTLGSALQVASVANCQTTMKMLLDAGADVNAQVGLYGNALQTAASAFGCIEVVQMLLHAGAHINAQGGFWGNALQAASYAKSQAVVEMLLDAGADANAPGGRYGNALAAAIQASGGDRNYELLQLLLRAGAEVNPPGIYRGSALIMASGAGFSEIVDLLLKAGADPDARCDVEPDAAWAWKHSTALEAALANGSKEIAQILLDAGADVNKEGPRVLSAALEGFETRGKDVALIRLVLDAGAEVNPPGPERGNALMLASRYGSVETVSLLLQAGADVNAKSHGDYSNALEAASAEGHEEVVQMLIDAGAEISARSNGLQGASYGGHERIVKILLEAGADVNTLDRWEGIARAPDGWFTTALEAAARWGHEEIVRLLIDAGADVNIRFERTKYRSALDAAEGNEKIERMLIDAGAVKVHDQLDTFPGASEDSGTEGISADGLEERSAEPVASDDIAAVQ
ncbi:unnamed protein product [Zymoseptoria tritici ST99CH_1E4]|uniref:Nephrocystin 3-like N-terminal domain-containing protein n=2 Tax=Zymoseptoria tritici TaxID=1047171 RepID=A0A2H1H4W6_ZYMTR|nr:unnamed protein product [Zymoseptoria tritici ST99CH_1E4]